MMNQPPKDSFVEKVRNETQSYIHDLLGRIGSLETDLEACRQSRIDLEDLVDGLTARTTGLERRLEREREGKEKLLRKVAGIEEQNREVSDRYAEVARRNNDLASLYVASFQLHGTLERAEILAVIREIVINLIGSEEFAVLSRLDDSNQLEMITSFGLDERSPMPLDPRLEQVLETGETVIFDPAPDADGLVAAVPLMLGSEVTGLIAIYSLLPQKEGRLGELDRELCSLLSRQAAAALYCTRLHSQRLQAVP
jgi:hypothetical protein